MNGSRLVLLLGLVVASMEVVPSLGNIAMGGATKNNLPKFTEAELIKKIRDWLTTIEKESVSRDCVGASEVRTKTSLAGITITIFTIFI